MKTILYTIIISCCFSLLYCCSDAKEKEHHNKARNEELRRQDSAALKIGVMPTIDCLPIVVAKELRLFDTLGVDVHLRYYHALSECRKALADNIVEGAAIETELMNEIKAQGTALTPKLKTDLSWQLLTAKKARISRIDQMSDKIIGADSHGMTHKIAELSIDSMLRHKQYVFIVQVEDVRVRTDMLGSGNIDAALLPEPFATAAVKKGARVIKPVKSNPGLARLLSLSKGSNPCGVVAFRDKALKDKTRRQQVEHFLKAVAIAKDSINKYGQEKYIGLLK